MGYHIIAYTSVVFDGGVALEDSEGNTILSENPMELLDFLTDSYEAKQYGELKVAFDLDTFSAPIFKLLGITACKALAGTEHRWDYEHGDIFYIRGKILSIEHKGRKAFVYHLKQFYDDEIEPQDPYEIQALAVNLVEALEKMGLHPRKLTSAVAIYEAEILNHMTVPTILDLPQKKEMDELVDLAEECCGKPWISAYQVGKWEATETFELDIRSSYPFQATKLYDLKYAEYQRSTEILDGYHCAFLKGEVSIHDYIPVSPIIHRAENGNLLCPVGTFQTIITLDDYLCMKRWKMGEFKLDYGWFIKFTAPVRPFNVPLQKLFGLRGDNGLTNKLAKLQSVGVYGKLNEKHDDGTVGKFYNPLYAAMIISKTNVQVCDFIYRHRLFDDLIAVGVDSVLTTKEVKLDGGDSMGDWRLKPPTPALVISPGRVITREKKPGGLEYDRVVAMINEHPSESYYAIKNKRRQTLNESVELDDLKGLAEMREFTSSLDLNVLRSEQDRVFPDFPRTGRDLLNKRYQSKPIKI